MQSAFASFKRIINLLDVDDEIDDGLKEIDLPVDHIKFENVNFLIKKINLLLLILI